MPTPSNQMNHDLSHMLHSIGMDNDQQTRSILLEQSNDNSLKASFIALSTSVYPFSVLLRVQNAHYTCAMLLRPAHTLHSIGSDQSKLPQSMLYSLF